MSARVNNNNHDHHMDSLLELVEKVSGFDIRRYRRAYLSRQVALRMAQLRCATTEDYVSYLSANPTEIGTLLDRLSIHVTSFFRDAEEWNFIQSEIIPNLLSKKGKAKIRIWCAGCSTGQEAFSLAIILAEALGKQGFIEQVSLFATDIDKKSLKKAKSGRYTESEVSGISEDLVNKYFVKANSSYVFDKQIRDAISFLEHDVLTEPFLTSMDIISFRNALIYFSPPAQELVAQKFFESLNTSGLLILGRAELPKGIFFRKVNHHHIFREVRIGEQTSVPPLQLAMLAKSAFDSAPCPQMIFDHDSRLVAANKTARHTFSISPMELGNRLEDLLFIQKIPKLREYFRFAVEERKPTKGSIKWTSPGEFNQATFSLNVIPISVSGALNGIFFSFHKE